MTYIPPNWTPEQIENDRKDREKMRAAKVGETVRLSDGRDWLKRGSGSWQVVPRNATEKWKQDRNREMSKKLLDELQESINSKRKSTAPKNEQ